MRLLLKFFGLSWLGLALCSAITPTWAKADAVDIYLFSQIGCPYCVGAEQALQAMANRRDVKLHVITIGKNLPDDLLFEAALNHFGYRQAAVPLVVIGSQAFVGFDEHGRREKSYQDAIETCRRTDCTDVIAAIKSAQTVHPNSESLQHSVLPEAIDIPIVGPVQTNNLSLLTLTLVMAAVDGFNPCAMWVLVFLIGLLLGLENRRRMWILGGTFLAATAVMYFAVMAAWLNLILFLGAVEWVRIGIGVLALGGGIYFLREYWTKPDATCHVTNTKRRASIMQAFRISVGKNQLILSMIGIAILAILVNFIELICSAGIPAVYTQVLALSDMPTAGYYSYLAIYLMVFMLDDVAVFATAMLALRVTGLTGRYARYSHLVGGILLLTIGAVLLLRPDLLSFNIS